MTENASREIGYEQDQSEILAPTLAPAESNWLKEEAAPAEDQSVDNLPKREELHILEEASPADDQSVENRSQQNEVHILEASPEAIDAPNNE